jgi:hypothetical protein
VAALHHDIMELAGPSLAEGSSTNFIYTIENSKKKIILLTPENH